MVQVVARYYPIVEPFLKAVTGATRVHIFDHTLRMGALQCGAFPFAALQRSGRFALAACLV